MRASRARSSCCDPDAPGGGPVGLDLGVANSVATSSGELMSLPVITDREWEKIGILQRRVARKSKGSRNREKAVRRLARGRQRLACRKKDAIHKLTTRLACEHELICVEDLKVTNMSASAMTASSSPAVGLVRRRG